MGRLSEARKKAKKAAGGDERKPPVESAGRGAVFDGPSAGDRAAAVAPPAAPPPEPAQTLADDILAGAAAEPAAPPAEAPALESPSPELVDELFGGFAESPLGLPTSGLADEILASFAAGKGAPPAVDEPLAHGVLEALSLGTEPGARLLGSSGLAEDVLPGTQSNEKARLGLDEIHEFETFFENDNEVEQLHLVLFHMSDEVFALDIDRVQEIIRVPAVTRVPHVAGHVLGVCNLRGRIVPVMELRKLMRMPSRPIDRLSRILVLDYSGKQIGMLVDRANEVAHIRVSDIEPPPEEVRSVDRNLVTAVARLNARMVFILDLDQVLSLK